MDEPPLNQSGKKTMDFHFSCHTPSTFREELMDFTLFYCFFIFVLDGPGMSRPFGMNARPMRGTCHQEDKQTLETSAELPKFMGKNY